MSTVEDLRAEAERAEQRLRELQAQHDEARERFREPLRAARDEAAAAQKAWCDAEAAQALLDEPDGERLAEALGLTLPE